MRVRCGDDLALTHDRSNVAERPQFLELVRDEDDGAAFIGKLAQSNEQRRNQVGRENRSRLVHDDQFGVLQQASDNLDPLPLSDRQRVHRGFRVHFEMQAAADICNHPGEFALGEWDRQ